tara:strand:+ start:10084 stop:10200 length:117 start_codon:yes stop_codon:yes gene_type:complete
MKFLLYKLSLIKLLVFLILEKPQFTISNIEMQEKSDKK